MAQETIYIALSWFYISLTLSFVANRLYIRSLRLGHPTLSDGLVVVAWIFCAGQSICDTLLYSHGSRFDGNPELDAGRPSDFKKIQLYQRLWFIEYAIYYVPLYCTKGAIICYLLEVAPPSFIKVRRALWVGSVLCVLGMPVTLALLFYQYWPLTASWESAEALDDYWSEAALEPYDGAIGFHIFTDIFIYAIPFFLIPYLPRVKTSQRVWAYGMFGAGFLLLVIGFMQFDIGAPASAAWSWDFWWGIHELNLAVTFACLPTLRVTVRRCLERRGTTGRASGSSSRKGSWAERIRRGELETREVAESDGDIEMGSISGILATKSVQSSASKPTTVVSNNDTGNN